MLNIMESHETIDICTCAGIYASLNNCRQVYFHDSLSECLYWKEAVINLHNYNKGMLVALAALLLMA